MASKRAKPALNMDRSESSSGQSMSTLGTKLASANPPMYTTAGSCASARVDAACSPIATINVMGTGRVRERECITGV